MRRPQKPFTVEVKKVRKGGFARFLGAGRQWSESDLAEEARKNQPAPPQSVPPRAEPAPPRRILEAIVPASESGAVDEPGSDASAEASPEVAGETETKPRRRGRPPKVVIVAEGAEPAAAPKVRAVPAPRKKSPAIKSRPAIELVPPVVAAPVSAPEPNARVAQSGRTEAASSLPRGERWKRRLPRVLW
ncbi:hypothetical protein QM467_14155 [Rhodoblastus sp. 17X3]|uniref:hypothetical protein n=1 Tax=Rhodoblastus sp. 17X3 TaxID=3047026 RepID=UPI0024B84141|nr:hypothetical protein [Rhodoblastus sp. 17X3]MDI9849197.1 hypothetical protein [Rhodoblastus sp. 17X3]